MTDPACSAFQAIEPDVKGWLSVGDGHRIYYEVSGHPSGIPVIFLHGGPGSSARAAHRRFFDPDLFRVVLFDQRGCGKSQPSGETRANTTDHLVNDIEQLRQHLDFGQVILFGGSWGATLALAYAQRFTRSVRGLVLRGVFLGSDDEVDWYLNGLGRFVGDARDALLDMVPDTARHDPVSWYAEAVSSADNSLAIAAASRWNHYESATMALCDRRSLPAFSLTPSALPGVRIQLHYFKHRFFVDSKRLVANCSRLAHLHVVIVQGRQDLICPPASAMRLKAVCPDWDLRLIDGASHNAFDPLIRQALIEALSAITNRV